MKRCLFTAVCLLWATSAFAQTGHIAPGAASTDRARQVILGTAQEFPALVAQGSNTDVMVEILRRMIWHLQLAGIPAGRQKNPSGAISGDKLTVQVDGAWHAFDVLSDRPSGPFDVHMDEVGSPNPQTDLGIADEGVILPSPSVPGTGGPAPTPGVCLPFPDPNIPRLELQIGAIYAQNERIFANLGQQIQDIKAEVLATEANLEAHRVAERTFRDQVLGFLKNRVVQIGLAGVAGKYLPKLFQ